MKTASVRDLRNHFPRVAAWIQQGESVEITKSGKPFAVLAPPPAEKQTPFEMPDFQAQLIEIWGQRVFTKEEVAAMRADEREGEEG